ncbi:DNA repair protein RadA [candidate division WWE3 bacterium]|uniref:DNA repair protein RadA n=1 Tax=candidate division WWE3 bacterium TaxID=2053526 RepID=A0A7X9HGY3_UNCKA|nr:DNA repair protein RadA [candidate division WWE3 bacterium]
MPKLKTVYICQNCAFESLNWVGQCPNCQSWNSFIEEIRDTRPLSTLSGSAKGKSAAITPLKLSSIVAKAPKRLSSNMEEFDRVLGGGFVPGQVILLGGEPGIGKSTILTEITRSLGTHDVMYVCGEESVDQIKLRTTRMGYAAENLFMLAETNVNDVTSAIDQQKNLSLVIVDSIQTLYHPELTGLAGSVTQVRGCTQLLTNTAKAKGVPIILIGHVTKEGVVAGPKVLEHLVDTILYLEGDSQHLYRILRTDKNRFGPVSEVGIFEMTESGMREVLNPSEISLTSTSEKTSGSCITVIMEGYRPLLFEVQALTVRTAFGYPKRTTSGFNVNRLQVLIAILEKRCGLDLSNHDVYLNVAGGFKINEYAADLAVCIAMASALKDKPVKPKTVVFGECGLNGEIRKVAHQDKRVKEAKKLGYSSVISPENCNGIADAIKKSI